MRFTNYLYESENMDRHEKYFSNGKNANTKVRRTTKKHYLLDDSLNKVSEIKPGEELFIIDDKARDASIGKQKKKHVFVQVMYKNVKYYIDVNDLETPASASRGESLGLQSTNLVSMLPIAKEPIIVFGTEYNQSAFKEANSLSSLSKGVINSIEGIPGLPNDIKDKLIQIIKEKQFTKFDWEDIDPSFKGEIGKYFGEVLSGFCILNNNWSVFSGDISDFKKQDITSFLVPISPSFKAVDTLFKTKQGMLPISNKKGGGTGASFFSNISPLLSKFPEKNINSMVIKQLKNIYNKVRNSNDVIGQIYEWGFTYLLKGIKISNPKTIYEKIRTGQVDDIEVLQVMSNIKKNHKKMKNISSGHLTAVMKNLPYSLTHLFLYTLHHLLTNDENAKNIIMNILGAKSYYQMDLNNTKWKKGEISYTVKKTSNTKLFFSPTRGKINDITSSHAKLNYILK